MEDHIHDVCLIGAGPAGLAVAARLREKTPSALFTDSEHQRYHWMKSSSSSRRESKPIKTSRRPTAADRLLSASASNLTDIYGGSLDICVLDSTSDRWMGAWNQSFERLNISHLRSPMFFHPDPSDRDGLLGFSYAEGREKELKEITGVVGKSLSKYQRKKAIKKSGFRGQETTYLDERSRPDYYRPSAKLFKSYCMDIACRYNLSSVVEKSEVKSISYCSESCVFTLQTATGIKRARIVVFAAGPAMKPSLPCDSPFHGISKGSFSHAFDKPWSGAYDPNIPPHVLKKIAEKRDTNVVVVGGGLSSAQISTLLSKFGVSKVWHLMRGPFKVKHFDLDLSWIGKYKNFQLASFWSADNDEERLEMLKTAKGGGSITPEYKKILLDLKSKGKLEIHERTIISGATWNDAFQTWTIETEPRIELPKIDHVIYSTGFAPDWNTTVPEVQPLLRDYPIKTVGGMPCLTNDLMWSDEVPFFVTGRFAGLRVGPAAGNLEGGRQGAERIAWKVGELLHDGKDRADSGYGSSYESNWGAEVDQRRLGLGIENQFGVLDFENSE